MGELDKLLAQYEGKQKAPAASGGSGSALDDLLAAHVPKDDWDQGEGEWGTLEPAWGQDAALLKKRLGKTPQQVRQMAGSPNYKQGMFTKADEYLREGTALGGALGSVPGRVVMGAADNLLGPAQMLQNIPAKYLAAMPMLAPARAAGILRGTDANDTELMNTVMALKGQYRDENISDQLNLPIIGDVPTAIGNALIPLPTGKAKAAVAGGSRLLQLAKSNAARNAGIGFVSGATAPDESGNTEDYWSNAAKRGAVGAGGATVLGGAGDVAASLTGLRKKLQANQPADVRPEVFKGDVAGSIASKRQIEAQELNKIIQGGRPEYAGAARNVLQLLEEAGDHSGKNIQASASLQMLRDRMAKNMPYDAVSDIAAKRDVRIQEMPNAISALDKQIAGLADNLSTENVAKIQKLKQLRDRLSSGPSVEGINQRQVGSPESQAGTWLMDDAGNQKWSPNRESTIGYRPERSGESWTAPTDHLNPQQKPKFSTIKNTLTGLKDDLAKIYESDRTGNTGSAQATAVAKAFKDDMIASLKKQGHEDLALLLAESEKGHAQFKDKWQNKKADRQLNRALDTATPDTILRDLYGTSSADAAKNLVSGLSDSGKESLKLLALEDLLKASKNTKGKPTEIDVRAMLTELEAKKPILDVLFEGTDKKRLDGLEKLLDASQRKASRVGGGVAGAVSGFGVGSMAGNPLAGSAIGAMAGVKFGGTKTARGVAVTDPMASGLYKLLSSSAGQKYLLEASRYEARSPKIEALLARLGKMAGSGSRTGPPKPSVDEEQ